MATVPSDEVAALRRVVFGKPLPGADAEEHGHEVDVALARLRELEHPASADSMFHDDQSDLAVEWHTIQRHRRIRAIAVAAAATLAVVTGGVASWQAVNQPPTPLPQNLPTEFMLTLAGLDEVTVLTNWKGRTVYVGESTVTEGEDCLLVVHDSVAVSSCDVEPVLNLHFDPGSDGFIRIGGHYEEVRFDWSRQAGLAITYDGGGVRVPNPGVGL